MLLTWFFLTWQLGSVQAKAARNCKEGSKNAHSRTKLQKLYNERTRNALCISGLLKTFYFHKKTAPAQSLRSIAGSPSWLKQYEIALYCLVWNMQQKYLLLLAKSIIHVPFPGKTCICLHVKALLYILVLQTGGHHVQSAWGSIVSHMLWHE